MTPRTAVIPEAQRLETIRLEYLDGMPLAEFHRALTVTGDYQVSYAGVRNYHTTRKAPVDYYAQVCRVFGIRLQWLLFGQGEMVVPPSAKAGEASPDEDWTRELPDLAPTAWDPGDPVSQAAFLDCLRKLDLARPGTRPLDPRQRQRLVQVLDTLVAGTLWILRGDRKAPRKSVRTLLLALGEGLPGPKQGSTYENLLKRMKMEGGPGKS